MNKLLAGLTIAAAGLFAAGASAAPLTLKLTQGADTVTVVDDGAGDTLNTNVDAVLFSGDVGTYAINVSTGLASPGALNFPQFLDLNSVNVGSGQLVIEISKTFDATSLPLSNLIGEIGGTIGGSSAGSVLFEILVDDILIDTQSFTSTASQGDNAFSGTEKSLVDIDGEYLLTLRITMNHDCSALMCGATSFDASIATDVPEPAALALFGAGLLGFGLVRRRKA